MNRHIRDEQCLFDPSRGRAGVVQHLVQCYIRSVRITQNHHAHGVAHEDDVDATLIEQTRSGIIVCRERGNLLAAPLHLAKIFHCACSQDQLAISERKLSRKRRCSAGFACSIYQLSAKRTTAPESLKSASKSLTVFFSPNKTNSGRISVSGRSTKVLKCTRGCGSCNRSSLIRWSPQ